MKTVSLKGGWVKLGEGAIPTLLAVSGELSPLPVRGSSLSGYVSTCHVRRDVVNAVSHASHVNNA